MEIKSVDYNKMTTNRFTNTLEEKKAEKDYKSQTVVMSDAILPDSLELNLPSLPNLVSTPRSAKMNMQQDSISTRDSELRRDSSSSNDSQSCKKLASLNEIEDLYSALQDLVKTNVSKIPSNQCVKNDSELPSSIPDETINDQDQLQITKINGVDKVDENCEKTELPTDSPFTRARSSSYTTPIIDTCKKVLEKKTVFRRAASTSNGFGNFKTPPPPHIRRISAQPFSKHGSIDDNSRSTGNRKTGRSISVGITNLRMQDPSTVETRDNKKWKHKLLSRIRSKTNTVKHRDINDDNKNSYDTTDSRRYSENDCDKKYLGRALHINGGNALEKSNTINKISEIGEELDINADDIDQLVEALQLEISDSTASVTDTSNKSAESELSKLESWFEKAAAEAVLHHSRTSSDYDNDSDTRTPPGSRDMRRRTINRNKNKAALKRNKSIHDPVKRERRMRQVLPNEDYVSNNINSFVRLSHAKSTPDLRDPESYCDSDDFPDSHDYSRDSGNSDLSLDSDVLNNGDYLNHEDTKDTENHTKSRSPKVQKPSRRISLDENVRLPKTPLFYTPNNDKLGIVTEIDVFEDKNCTDDKKNYNRPVSMPAGIPTKTVNPVKHSDNGNSGSEELNKMRRKSLSSPDGFLCNDTKALWESTNGDSLSFETTQTDDRSSYCERSVFDDLQTDSVFPSDMFRGDFWNETETTTNTATSFSFAHNGIRERSIANDCF